MKVVHKFPLKVKSLQELEIDGEARFIHVDVQNLDGKPTLCVWAEVDNTSPKTKRGILMLGTGDFFPPTVIIQYHIGSLLLSGGTLVVHFYAVHTNMAKETPNTRMDVV